MSMTTFAAIVHVFPNRENLLNSFRRQMTAFFHQRYDLLELRKISFLLSREKRKPFEERNHILYDGAEVCYLVIPNAIRSTSKSAVTQVSFKQSEYHSIFLRHVEADGNLPWNRIILARTKGNVEASFTVSKSREVVTYFRRNCRDSCLHCCLSC